MDNHNTTDRRCKSWDLGPKVLASFFRFGSYGFGDGQFDSPLAATITCTGEILMWRPKGTRTDHGQPGITWPGGSPHGVFPSFFIFISTCFTQNETMLDAGMVFIRRDLSSIHKHIIKLNLSCWLSKTTLWLRWFTRWPSVDSWGDDDLFPACNEHFPVLCRFGPVAKFWREQSYPGWEGFLSQQGHQRPGVWLWFPRCMMEKEASCGHLECEGRRRTDAFRVSCFDELAADFMILHRCHSVIPRMEDGGAALIFLW
jgi:hypothetical protein